MLASKLLSAAGGTETPYVDDCFQVVTRTGTGSTATITTGFQPDLVWTKARNTTEYHCLFDQSRGVNTRLCTNATSANETVSNSLTAFGLTGFTLGSSATVNSATNTYVNWVFAKKAKFFDCGTYVGNGATWKTINHALGASPGMVWVKRADQAAGDWFVFHRSLTGANVLKLNTTDAQAALGFFQNVGSTSFDCALNTNGATYVWYAFAHDTSTD